MDFEEWFNRNYSGAFDMPHPREAYEAGQQSKQEQINKALELLRQPMRGTVADLLSELEDILNDT